MKPAAAAPATRRITLLAWCDPWLVALPVSTVRRIVAGEAMRTVAGAIGDGAWLGTVDPGDGRLPAWDLGRLLGLGGGGDAWVLIDRPLPAALRVGRCLQVVDLGRTVIRPLPGPAGGPPGTSCFRAEGLAPGLHPAPEFGLLLTPDALLADMALEAAS